MPESHQTFQVNYRTPNFWTSQSSFLLYTGFQSLCQHLFIDKPVVIIPRAQLKNLGSKQYPSYTGSAIHARSTMQKASKLTL